MQQHINIKTINISYEEKFISISFKENLGQWFRSCIHQNIPDQSGVKTEFKGLL